MKRKIFMILALLCAFAQGAWAQNYDVWDGHSEQQPRISGYWVNIDNAANLAYVRNHWNDIADGENPYYKKGLYLWADLDMSAASWIPLGFNDDGYEGTFDGNGHTIKIRIEGGDDNGRALFDEIGEYATVKNLHVDGYINVGDAEYVAGIVSDNDGLIENCWVSANITSNHYNLSNDADLGGIAGQNSGLIRYCCMTGNVTNTAGNSGVGGLVGRNNGRDYMRYLTTQLHEGIYHCTFYGSVSVDHVQDSKYVGQNNGSTHYQYDAFNQTEYDSASGNDMYRRAIKYPYSVTVNTVGPGSIRTEAAGEYDVPGTYPNATFTLHVTSGSVARVTITDADGNDIPLQGQAHDSSSYWFVMQNKNITAKVVFYENWPTQGNGTEEYPYLISSADDWNKFAHNVTYGRNYSGKYVKLTNDISVTTMAGGYQADDNYQPFSGTFDGDGHTLTLNVNNQSRFAAPFKCVSGATIKNLRTAGTIDGTGNADGKLLAGIIGVSFGNTTITRCRSSVTLTTAFGEDAALAGLVAGTKGGSLTIEGCVFDGSMTGASNTRCAGIAGYEYTATTTTISDCLFVPATLTISTADDNYTKTFSRDPDATITGCYYTQPLGAAQGTAAYFGNINVPNTLGDLVTDYGVVKAYANGLFFNGKYYYSDAGSWSDPYIIDSEDVFARIAPIVNSGVFDFVGKHFSLICDLDLSGRNWIPIGTTDRPFRGNFNGNNHTISNLTVNNPSGDYNGLFGYVKGVIGEVVGRWDTPGTEYIRNFVVKNANVRGRDYTGGVVGRVFGQLDFENVVLDGATVEGASFTSGFMGSAEGDYQNMVGQEDWSDVYVTNCLFINGSVTENNTSHEGYDYPPYFIPRGSYAMFGNIHSHTHFTKCYFSNIVYNGATAREDYFNVQAHPITVNAPSNINYSVETALGINYNDAFYVPDTLWRRDDMTLYILPIIDTVHLRLSYDASPMVTSVKVNGIEMGTAISNYDIIVNGRIATSYTVTVECEPGLTGSGTEDDPYLITSTELWNWFAITVNNGAHYSGKFVRLDADIDISTTVGLRGDKPFSGTFLGNRHTLTTNISSTTTGTGANEQGVAPFHYIKDATIKDLTVAGTIASASYHTSGLVGFADGTNLIENCIVTATLDISSDYAGGIIGHGLNSATTIRGCVFAGTINGVDGNRENIGGIWGWSNSGTPALVNCLEAGTYTNIASMHPMGLQGGSGTITNCFYVNPQVGSPQNACTVSGAIQALTDAEIQPVGDPTATYNVSDITVYVNGISYGGNFYYHPDRNVKITGLKWYAIATPMHDDGQDHESIVNVANLTTDNYDLLRYDETTGTWENQKAGNGATGFTTLEPGHGYIYRCSEARTLTYTGVPNNEESYSVSLTASSTAGDLKGFNLVGNPYPFSVTMYRPFYSLGADGIWQAHASGESLEAGQGALVYATSDETLTFYAATRSTNPGMDALPALPKALCLGGNGDDPSNHAISQSVNLPFAHQDGNSIVVTGTGTLQAYDIMGRLLFRMELNTEHLTLNTSLFPSAGVYLLRLGSQSQKIVIR